MNTKSDLVTVAEVAKMAGVSRQAIDKRIRVRKVVPVIYGKTRVIKREDVARLVP